MLNDDTTLINEVLKSIPNKYMATMVASKRAREINEGARPLVKVGAKKPTTIALAEIAEGLVVPGLPGPEAIMPDSQKELPSPRKEEE